MKSDFRLTQISSNKTDEDGGCWRLLVVYGMLDACFHAGFLNGCFCDPEDGGYMILRNVG
jgi:hypothetical protein